MNKKHQLKTFKHTSKITIIIISFLIIFIAIYCITYNLYCQNYNYPWLEEDNSKTNYSIKDIPVPNNYKRVKYQANTFQDWLQHLPLKQNEHQLKLYNGSLKTNQNAHYKIINIDVGTRDLQQCADAIIRLYSEYLYSQNRFSKIAFNFTSGDRSEFSKWIKGYRPIVKGNHVKWKKSDTVNQSYNVFRNYLNNIFMYSGSYSLSNELKSVNKLNDIKIGDIFIQGGFPGHAVIVVDVAIHTQSQKKKILLAQSYMPAQEIHVLKNLYNKNNSPWYELGASNKLNTPEWTFNWGDLKQFPK